LIFPGGRLQIATQEAEERGLAAAVGANKADAHAGGDLEVQVRKKSPAGEFVAARSRARRDFSFGDCWLWKSILVETARVRAFKPASSPIIS